MIAMQAHAQDEVNWLVIQGGGWGWGSVARNSHSVLFVSRAVASEAREEGLTSLIVSKVSASRRTTQGCTIYTWSTSLLMRDDAYLVFNLERVDLTVTVAV